MANTPYLSYLKNWEENEIEQIMGFTLRLSPENKKAALRSIRRLYVIQEAEKFEKSRKGKGSLNMSQKKIKGALKELGYDY